jgi:hypothetical protein
LDGGDGDLAQVAQAHHRVPVQLLLVAQLAFGRRPHRRPRLLAREELLEVVTRREVLAFGFDEHDLRGVVAVGFRDGGEQRGEHRCVLRVGRLRAGERDDADRRLDVPPQR